MNLFKLVKKAWGKVFRKRARKIKDPENALKRTRKKGGKNDEIENIQD